MPPKTKSRPEKKTKAEIKKADTDKKKRKKNKKQKNKPGMSAMLKIALIIFVAISIIFIGARTIGGVTLKSLASDIKVFFQSLGWGDGYPCKTTGEPAQQIFIEGGNVFVFSKDKTILLSSSAKKLAEIPIEYGNPAIKYKDRKAIIYDRDSAKFRIQNSSEIISEKEADGTILAAAIGKKGNFAAATQGTGSTTVLKVYGKNEKEVYKWEFSGEKVTDIDLSNDGDYAVVSTMISKDAQINSKVYVFKFDSKKYVSCFDYEKSAVVGVEYDNAHNITLVSNTGRGYIKDNSVKGETESFKSDNLFKCSESPKKYSAVALKKYGGDNFGSVKIFKGQKLVSSFDINKEIKDVYCTNRYTFVLSVNSVLIYKNSNGKLKKEVSADLSVTEIAVKGSKIYMMSPLEIIREKF